MQKGLQIAIRTAWYILRIMIVVGLIALAAYYCFHLARQYGGMYIIATEGLEARAGAVLKDTRAANMSEFLSGGFMEHDELLFSQKYQDFRITNYNYTVKIKSIHAPAFGREGYVDVVEEVANLSGELTDAVKATLMEGETPPALPPWPTCEYRVHLLKDSSGRWYIQSLELLEVIDEKLPSPSPEVAATPAITPEATPDADAVGESTAQPEEGAVVAPVP